MNGFSFNSAGFNSGGVIAQLVYLPSVGGGIDFALSERYSTNLTGSTGISFASYGDISRLSIFGNSPTGLSLAATGVLEAFSGALIGAVTTNLDIAASGSLTNYIRLSANTGVSFDPTGSLLRYAEMAGDTGIDLANAGTLTVKVFLGSQSAGLDMALSGDPRATLRLSGDTGISLDVNGVVVARQLLSGAVDLSIESIGSLSVNALGREPDANVMYRLYKELTMVRSA